MIAAAWHWTWQDPVALALVAATVLAAVVLARRRARRCACPACPMRSERPTGLQPPRDDLLSPS